MSIGRNLYNKAERVHTKRKQEFFNNPGFLKVFEKLEEKAEKGYYNCAISADYIEDLFGSDIVNDSDFIDFWKSIEIEVDKRFMYGDNAYFFNWGGFGND